MRVFPSSGAVLIFAGLAVSTGAQQAPAAKRDPKVQAVIDQTLAAYRALNSLHVKASATMSGPAEMLGGAPSAFELRYQKPNKLYTLFVESKGQGAGDRKITACDGATFWTYSSASNTYTKTKAPASLKNSSLVASDMPECDLLFRDKDPFEDIPGSAAMTLGAPAKVGSVDVDVLQANATEQGVPFSLSFQILIGQKDHLIHGMAFQGSGKDPQGKEMKLDLRLTYDVVDTNPTFTPADFAFAPPVGAKPAMTEAVAKPAVKKPAAKKPAKKK
jgi:outer membrane lipoprotein-sorting protein